MPWKKSEPMEQRVEFVLRALRTENFRALCQEYGISTNTGYKWRERFLRQGQEGLVEESRRPRSSPQPLSQEEVCEIVRLKLSHPHWGRRKIRELYLRQHGKVASPSAILGLSRLSAWWVALGINLERGRPGHPQDNGAHERLHRDSSPELECFNQEVSQQALDLWRQEFNYHQSHLPSHRSSPPTFPHPTPTLTKRSYVFIA